MTAQKQMPEEQGLSHGLTSPARLGRISMHLPRNVGSSTPSQ
jgi:hypothetical protein